MNSLASYPRSIFFSFPGLTSWWPHNLQLPKTMCPNSILSLVYIKLPKSSLYAVWVFSRCVNPPSLNPFFWRQFSWGTHSFDLYGTDTYPCSSHLDRAYYNALSNWEMWFYLEKLNLYLPPLSLFYWNYSKEALPLHENYTQIGKCNSRTCEKCWHSINKL